MSRLRPSISPTLAVSGGYYLLFIAMGLSMSSLGPTLPALAQSTGTGVEQISSVFVTRAIGNMLGSLLGGRIFDRMRGNPVLGGMMLGVGGLMVITPLAPNIWMLNILMFLTGILHGIINVGGNTLLIWVHGSKVGPYMSALHLFFGLGSLLCPMIIAQMVLITTNTMIYWVLAALAIPMALPMFFLPSPPHEAQARGEPPAMTNLLLVGLFAGILFCYAGASFSFTGWIYTYALTRNLADAVGSAYLTSLYWGSFTIGRLASIPLTIRMRPHAILLADYLLGLASVLVMLVWQDSLLAASLGSLGIGLAVASIYPTVFTLAQRTMNVTGRISSWFAIGNALGGVIVPWVVGQYFERSGPQVLLLALVIIFIAALVLVSTLQPALRRIGHAQ